MKDTISDINQLDVNKIYSYADYLTWRFQERVELIKGKIFKMSPAPKRIHQEISREIQGQFYLQLKETKCHYYDAPFDVRFPKKSKDHKEIFTVVQPDLCIICDTNKLDDRGCIGAPDLIVEILSKSTTKKDLNEKYELYQEHGVKEYLIFHPNDQVVDHFILRQQKYELVKIYAYDDTIHCQSIAHLSIDLKEVFDQSLS